MVENVENFTSKLKLHALPIGDGNKVKRREIKVDKIRAEKRGPCGVAQSAGRSLHKTAGVEKFGDGLAAGKPATAGLVWAILSRSIPSQRRSRIVYRTNEKRKPGVDTRNCINLPVAQHDFR